MKTYKIGRTLYPSGWLPYSVDTIDGKFYHDNREFSTLKDLKEAYGIKKLKKAGTGWAINSRGTKKTWNKYEGTD